MRLDWEGNKIIEDHLRKRRLDVGLLQKEVAQQLGVTTDTVRNWEANRTASALPYVTRIVEFLE